VLSRRVRVQSYRPIGAMETISATPLVEQSLGKGEVVSSILTGSTKQNQTLIPIKQTNSPAAAQEIAQETKRST
jgi:hypothetical protein